MTGRRGYLTRLASQDARVHRRYAVPRLVPLTRACRHSAHRPGSTGSTGLIFSSLTTCLLPWVTGSYHIREGARVTGSCPDCPAEAASGDGFVPGLPGERVERSGGAPPPRLMAGQPAATISVASP